MKNKVKAYFNEINECEKLERRSSKDWDRIGTIEETVKMVKFKERKTRNGIIAWTIYVAGISIAAKIIHNK